MRVGDSLGNSFWVQFWWLYLYFFLVPALLRDCSLCWNHWTFGMHTHSHKKNIAPTHTISRILILNPDFIAYTHQIWVSFQWHIAALIITFNLQTKAPKKCHNQPCFIQISCCFSTHTKWHNNSLKIFLNGILTKQYLKNSNKFLWLNSWAVAKLFQK